MSDYGTLVLAIRVHSTDSTRVRVITLARIPCEYVDARNIAEDWLAANSHVQRVRVEFLRASTVLAE